MAEEDIMYYFQDVINGPGSHVKKMVEAFKGIYIGFLNDKQGSLSIKHVLFDEYNCKILYVVYPDREIIAIWPNIVCDDVKYGTSSKTGTLEQITPAVLVRKGDIGIYFCLTPNGFNLDYKDNFGV